MKTQLFNYLRFTRAERNGTMALMLLALVIFITPEISRHFRSKSATDFSRFKTEIHTFRTGLEHPEKSSGQAEAVLFSFDPNTASEADLIRLGLSKKVAGIIGKYRDKGGIFREASDLQKIWSLEKTDYERLLPYIDIPSAAEKRPAKTPEATPTESFAFDPNTVTEAELFRMGLPSRTVKSILNYRTKGGQFRKKEDLEKIYTLEAADYARLAPMAIFTAAQTPEKYTNPVAYAGMGRYPGKPVSDEPVDINSASIDAWRSLPGIGETRARQLLSYREKLGGFISIEQIGQIPGLPDSVFQNIKPRLEIQTTAVHKINLNLASVTELDAHPYISKRQAELIVAYREQHGPFTTPEDIGKMRAIADPVWMAKVRPYLGVD